MGSLSPGFAARAGSVLVALARAPFAAPARARAAALGRWILARDLACGALAVLALAAFFLSTPILRVRDGHFSSADISQAYTLTRVEASWKPQNQLLSDPMVEFQAWAMFNRSEIAAGRIPLWNPWNGLGAPHFANYQSAVLSPFNLPFYVVGFRLALLGSALLKLLALGLATFLFLRELRLSRIAALLGAAAFMFSGHNALLLAYPHSAAMATLPATLFFAERAFRRFLEAGDSRAGLARTFWPLAGLALTLSLGLFSGHPEPFYFSALALALYCAGRLAGIVWSHRNDGVGVRGAALLGARLLACAALAAGAGAVVVLPFLEYLRSSTILGLRSGFQTPLHAVHWPLHFFPNAFGSPTSAHKPFPDLPLPNYEAAVSDYSGSAVVLLALVALAFARRDRRIVLLAILAMAWVFYAYNLFDAGRLFARIPTLHLAPVNRSQGLYLFAMAALAALGLDHLIRRESASRSLPSVAGATLVVLLGAALLATGLAAVDARLDALREATPVAPEFLDELRAHVGLVGSGLALATVACAGLLFSGPRMRAVFAGAALAAVLLQTAVLFKDYNPTCPDRFFFPRTPAIAELQRKVGNAPLAIVGPDTLPPDTNLAYGLSLLASYDAMNVRWLDQLHVQKFGASGNWRIASRASRQALGLFGCAHLLTKDPVREGEEFLDPKTWAARLPFLTGELLPGARLVQEFLAPDDGLRTLSVFVDRTGKTVEGRLELALHELPSRQLVAREVFDLAVLLAGGRVMQRAVLDFDPLAESRGRAYALVLTVSDTVPGRSVRARASHSFERHHLARFRCGSAPFRPSAPEAGWARLTHGRRVLPGGLMMDLSVGRDELQIIGRIDDFYLYRWRDSLGQAWFIDQALTVADDQRAWEWMADPHFDVRDGVLLVDPTGPPLVPRREPRIAPLRLERVSPTLVRVACDRGEPGWVVVAQTFFPGWKARVDGVEAPLLRANYAFQAVEVPGRKCVVELSYEPESFRLGLWISGASAAIGLALLLWRLLRGPPR